MSEAPVRMSASRTSPVPEGSSWRLPAGGRNRIPPNDLNRIKGRHKANGLDHLKEPERERLKGLLGDVPAAVMPSEHRADEIAAAC